MFPTNLHTKTTGNILISNFPQIPDDVMISEVTSDISKLPILIEPAVTYEIYLPPVDHICPITFLNDDLYGLPYVRNISPTSPIGQQLPTAALKQQWILSIGSEEPIHASSATDELLRLRTSHANKKITITMAPRVIDKKNQYEEARTKFDQMRPILASASTPLYSTSSTLQSTKQTTHINRPSETINIATQLSSDESTNLIDPAGSVVPTISILVHSSSQPELTANINDCFNYSNPLKSFWIQTIYEQYYKNASYRVFYQAHPKTNYLIRYSHPKVCISTNC